MNAPAKITSKGQITVPKAIRALLNLETGDHVMFIQIDGEVVLKAKNRRAVELTGLLGPPPSGETLTNDQIDSAIGQAASQDDQRINREWNRDDA